MLCYIEVAIMDGCLQHVAFIWFCQRLDHKTVSNYTYINHFINQADQSFTNIINHSAQLCQKSRQRFNLDSFLFHLHESRNKIHTKKGKQDSKTASTCSIQCYKILRTCCILLYKSKSPMKYQIDRFSTAHDG